MNTDLRSRFLPLLIVGDLLALAIITLIGFASHGEATVAFLPRMLTTFVPLSLAWFVTAPWLGCFDPGRVRAPGQLWRPVLAMLMAAPLTGVLRAAWLGGVVLPLFVLILGASAALGMLVWRGLYALLIRRGRA